MLLRSFQGLLVHPLHVGIIIRVKLFARFLLGPLYEVGILYTVRWGPA